MSAEQRPRRASLRARVTGGAVLAVTAVLAGMSVLLVYLQIDSALGHLDELLSDEAEAIGQAFEDGTRLPTLFDDDRVVIVYGADREVLLTAGAAAELLHERIDTPDDKGIDLHVAGELHRVVSEPYTTADGRAGWVVLAEPRDELDASVRRLIHSLLITVPAAAIVLWALVWIIVGRLLRPVERIRAEVAAIGIDELDHRVPEPGTGDEIADLAVTMNSMLDRLEQSVHRQQQFVGDASHELRTPLARMRARLEVDEARPDLADPAATRRAQLIDLAGMQALVDDLLLLAAADAGAPAPAGEPVDLDDLVLAELAAEASIVTVDARRVSGAQVVGSRERLTRVVRNLILNATAHAASAIAVSLAERDGEAVLTVEDDGPGIPATQRDHVLRRFSRLDAARAGTGHAGLGLAIVADVVAQHGGRVEIDRSVLGGALVRVVLPAAPAAAATRPPTPSR